MAKKFVSAATKHEEMGIRILRKPDRVEYLCRREEGTLALEIKYAKCNALE